MAKQIEVPTTPSPQKPSYQFLSFTGGDWVVVIIGFVLMYVSMAVVAGFVAFILMLIALIYWLWPLMNGRRYYVVIMTIYAKVWIEGVLERVEWSANPRHDLKKWKRLLVRCFIEPDPFPFSIDKLHHIGLLFLRSNRTDTVVFTGDGSSFQRESPSKQAEMLDRLSDAIKDLSSFKALNPKIGLGVRRRPFDKSMMDEQQNTHLLVDTMIPEVLVRCSERKLPFTEESIMAVVSEDPTRRKKELSDLNCYVVAQAAKVAATSYGLSHDMFATLTIRRSRRLQLAARSRRSKLLDPKDAQSEAIVKLADDFREQLLDMGIQNPSILDQRELEDFVRAGWDVAGMDEYRKARLDDKSADARDTAALYRPQDHVTTHDKVSQLGKTRHMTFRFVGLPKDLFPAQMAALTDTVATEAYLQRSLTSQVVKGNKEYNVLTGFLNVLESLMDALSVFIKSGKKTDKRREGLSALTDRLADQEHITYFGLWYTLSSSSEDPGVFERDTAKLRRAAARQNCKIELVEGTAWTRRATQSCLYGVAQM